VLFVRPFANPSAWYENTTEIESEDYASEVGSSAESPRLTPLIRGGSSENDGEEEGQEGLGTFVPSGSWSVSPDVRRRISITFVLLFLSPNKPTVSGEEL